MKINNIKHNLLKTLTLLLISFVSLNVMGQTCDFSLSNSGNTGGYTEYYLVLDATGNVAQVISGAGPVTVTGQGLGTVTEVMHLMYDPTDPPMNVPPVAGDDPANILGGCTNNFLGSTILLECLCEEDEVSAAYVPAGGDMLMYFLADGAGMILDANMTGNFGTDEAIGDYFIYALTYESTDPPTTLPAVGGNISDFSNDGCYNEDFLSSGCCAQKISCCDLELALDLPSTTCDGAGNLVFVVDATMATGVITGDNGATFTDMGGGNWEGMVPVTSGTSIFLTATDAGAMCEDTITIDATFITCDDANNPVCTLEGALSTNAADFICNADGTISTDITVTGAAGTSATVDGATVGGNGVYSVVLTGKMGTVVLTDPDGFGTCQFDLMYDLNALLPSTAPTISPSPTIELCPNVLPDPVTATGSSPTAMFTWYTDAALTMPVGPGLVSGANNEIFNLGVLTTPTLTIYVAETTAGGCAGVATAITYTRTGCSADAGRF